MPPRRNTPRITKPTPMRNYSPGRCPGGGSWGRPQGRREPSSPPAYGGRQPLAASEHVERAPRPIPGGIDVGGTTFHVFLPGAGNEPSTITDFKGLVGLANIGVRVREGT